ncbi:hypothetical protein QFC22_001983 [Naganishia vaughanmartiniae]|uniref:Uncharacterized protein n=1 Tax=Naganishia vaughanmartiniae TaxID=1424756 RepID=A0ACC2XGK2_9TREE|nr:hypothetical protein QFC22_001983 [Naganishia vaughanmartiniae]
MFGLRNVLLRSASPATALRRSLHVTPTLLNANAASDDVYSKLNDGERGIYDKLKAKFGSKTLDVVDVSGGCGSFYAIHISSPQFKGLSTIKQHKLVNECLKEEVKAIHGLQYTRSTGFDKQEYRKVTNESSILFHPKASGRTSHGDGAEQRYA